jgi:apolipoprotein D and lipocalin family protein
MNKKVFYFVVIIVVIGLSLSGCAIIGSPVLDNIQTVDQVDLERYTGVWYEIASLPTWFANDLVCVTATYTLQDDGKIEVVNQGFQSTPDGKVDKITGTAWVPNPDEPGQLKVSFFPLISSQYNIIALDEVDYSYAMVTGRNYTFLWILSRTPQMNSATYDMLIQQAEDWGYDVSKIEVTPQICSD